MQTLKKGGECMLYNQVFELLVFKELLWQQGRELFDLVAKRLTGFHY